MVFAGKLQRFFQQRTEELLCGFWRLHTFTAQGGRAIKRAFEEAQSAGAGLRLSRFPRAGLTVDGRVPVDTIAFIINLRYCQAIH